MKNRSATAQSLKPLLDEWQVGMTEDYSHPDVHWCVKAMFDHDWEHHVLVKQWHKDGDWFSPAGYSLWLISDGFATFVDEWPNAQRPPLIHAASLVASWTRALQGATQ
jgi:hypothetical protein